MVQQSPNQPASAVHKPKLKVFLVLQRSQFGSHKLHEADPALMQAAALLWHWADFNPKCLNKLLMVAPSDYLFISVFVFFKCDLKSISN